MLEEYSDDLTKIDVIPQDKLFRITYDSSVRKFKLICKHQSLLDDVQKKFSCPNPGAFFASRYGYKLAERLYAVNKFGYFDVGLLFEILNWIKTIYSDLSSIIVSDKCKSFITDYLTPLKSLLKTLGNNFSLSNLSEDLGRNNELRRLNKKPFEFRDYQANSVKSLIFKGYGRGLIEIPTAGGKSFILANFIWNIHKNFNTNYRYLILVPNKLLVEQFYKDLIDYGYPKEKLSRFTAGMTGKNKFNYEALVVIANRQYIYSNMDKLPKIDVLICDEAHTMTANASYEFIERLNCKIKIGCSGTLPRDDLNHWKLTGLFGLTVYQEDITTLLKRGYISNLKITLLKIIDTEIEKNRNYIFHVDSYKKYKADVFGLSEIAFNEAYIEETAYFEKHYKELYLPVFRYLQNLLTNTLVLFDRIDLGQNLFEYAKELYCNLKDVFYIDGSIVVSKREEIREKFEEKDGNLLIALSACFSTGVNIKRLSNLVFIISSKAFARTVLSIGRTLRLHESKQEAHLIDCSFNFKYSQKHLQERLYIYKLMYNKKPDEEISFKI